MRHLRFVVTAAVVSAAALTLASCAGDGGSSGEYDPDADVTLTFAFWGNDDRADRYNQLIEAFQTEHPNITVNTTFTDFPSYWEKRQTEVAGGGLPDVFQFSDSYLRQSPSPATCSISARCRTTSTSPPSTTPCSARVA
ncbi:ABC transporter substrate-binding protein [Microbacterium luteum]|uniref:ABC transporter substrate-binding protein n=1 Tax=Microbacterium TaxID=33882 RepID=UPI0023505599|nr:extracellular solute-binding protein [Microbacterium luteum]